MFMTREDLTALSGAKRRGNVIQWLRGNGYKFDIGTDGWPRVLRDAVAARLMPAASPSNLRSDTPDFSVYGTPKKAA